MHWDSDETLEAEMPGALPHPFQQPVEGQAPSLSPVGGTAEQSQGEVDGGGQSWSACSTECRPGHLVSPVPGCSGSRLEAWTAEGRTPTSLSPHCSLCSLNMSRDGYGPDLPPLCLSVRKPGSPSPHERRRAGSLGGSKTCGSDQGYNNTLATSSLTKRPDTLLMLGGAKVHFQECLLQF